MADAAKKRLVRSYEMGVGRQGEVRGQRRQGSPLAMKVLGMATTIINHRMLQEDIMIDRIKYCLRHFAAEVDECMVCARTGKCLFIQVKFEIICTITEAGRICISTKQFMAMVVKGTCNILMRRAGVNLLFKD
ncbi:hypothetical protein ZWY2020_031980 [Hordeum vulgare]|nr:hypothetical protein ZWY2020_031980 [Hordeum vulgare]